MKTVDLETKAKKRRLYAIISISLCVLNVIESFLSLTNPIAYIYVCLTNVNLYELNAKDALQILREIFDIFSCVGFMAMAYIFGMKRL